MSDVTYPLSKDAAVTGDDAVIREAHKRFAWCQQWESTARNRWMEDYKFAHGDSENNYQWPDIYYQARNAVDRPALTINKVRQHNLLIINEAKQRKSGIKYRATGDGATAKAAEVWEGIARHIQDISRAQIAFGMAIEFQVDAGLGFTRIVTDYVDAKSWDQEAYILTVDQPMSVFLDPDARELDGSDAKYGFIFSDRPRAEIEAQYPELKGKLTSQNAVDGEDTGWTRDDHVREAEYYRIVEEEDELIRQPDGLSVLKSLLTPDLLKSWEEEAAARGDELQRRPVMRKKLEWKKIVGAYVVDEKTPPGRSIPIIPWIGEQTIVDRILDRKGHTRYLKDAQRMLNYNRSAAVEYGALQNKSPWLAPMKAVEGVETYYENANTSNPAWLPYNHRDDEGNEIPAPSRQEPPQAAPVFIEGARDAERDMMMASGQYESEFGAQSNEVTGRAIQERQRQADRATYQFTDQQAIAIRRHGQILLEIIPVIYDTPGRVLRVLGEDGDETHVQLDPSAAAAHQEALRGAMAVFNPNVGRYEVVSDVGPDYATQREEAFNAIVQVLTMAPELIAKIGDLLFKAADFPLADQIAERLKPGYPPEVQQAIQSLQVQLQRANKALAEAMQALTEERLKVKDRSAETVIDAFDADTRRIAALKDQLGVDPEVLRAFVREEMRQAMQDNLGPAVLSVQPDLASQASGAPIPGATGALPIRVPNVGVQAATPGGM